ncbi:MAG: hypothetical protein J5J06_03760 [Phycisphaerae bacterium]|nr:hypothetical protein [Phycisphaerae bacterium]
MEDARCGKIWRSTGKRGGAVCLLIAVCLTGCRAPRPVAEVRVANPWLGPLTIAVGPAINLSGSSDFDPAKFADVMASELAFAEGVSVIPVSRVLAALAQNGQNGITSPEQALELCGVLGADAILVFAVTEYEPYDPPRIGISAQLFGRRPAEGFRTVDPATLAREARGQAEVGRAQRRVLAQMQRVFDAGHGAVSEDIRRFAAQRGADGSPYGWRKYVVSQQGFMRYCCHRTIGELLDHPLSGGPAGEKP